MVVDVEPGGPAAAAGLMPGDVVIALGGYTIFNADSLAAALEGRTRARGRVRLQVRRADQVLEIALPSRGVAV